MSGGLLPEYIALIEEDEPDRSSLAGGIVVELILSEGQLGCLKAAVTIGSEASAVLGRAVSFGSKLFQPELFAVKCTREIAERLFTVALRFCPDVVPEIRAAIKHEQQQGWGAESG